MKAGLIDELQLQSALAHQRQWGGKLGDILVNNGFLDEMMLWRGLSKQLGVPLVSLPEQKMVPGIEKQVPLELCQKHSIFPLSRDDKGLTIATSDPGNVGGIDEVAFRLGVRLRIVLAPDREVEWAIRRYHQGDPAQCPPPRLRRQTSDDTAPAPPPPPAGDNNASLGRAAGTPIAELVALAARTAQLAQLQAQSLPPTTMPPAQAPAMAMPPSSQPFAAGAAPSDVELMIRETAHLLRFLVEGCTQRGVFTREDYLKKLKSL